MALVAGGVLMCAGGAALLNKHGGVPATAYAQTAAVTSTTSSSGSKSATSLNHATKPNPTSSQGAGQLTTIAKSSITQAPAKATLTPAPAVSPSLSLYANPASNVSTNARAWAAANPADAGKMNRLASTPMAAWFGDFSGNVASASNSYVSAAAAAGQVPVLVAYNIPQRDCGSYSSGGASSPAAYQAWIDQFAAGIGQRGTIVILEPDALAGMDCLSSADQQNRLQLLSYAVHSLRILTKAAVYIDAGHYGWQSAAVMASRLQMVDLAEASGFSLDVSNFETTANNAAYGISLSSAVGGKHFVIDTSRNGNGPAGGTNGWCNPDGRAFGNAPTLQTGSALIDAYLWIKNPGESDGQCGPSQNNTSPPPAGAWWPQYALALANNSGW